LSAAEWLRISVTSLALAAQLFGSASRAWSRAAGQVEGDNRPKTVFSLQMRGAAMYSLIIVIAVMSSGLPVGVTSQMVGEFANLDQCKDAATKSLNGGALVDLNLSTAIFWQCVYTRAP
jgi:hypothetical protein